MAVISCLVAREQMLECHGKTLPVGIGQMILMREAGAGRRPRRQPVEIMNGGQELLAALPKIGLECVEEITIADLGKVVEELGDALEELAEALNARRPAGPSRLA